MPMDETGLEETVRNASPDLAQKGERRRSVRTTFNLSKDIVERKEWLSSYFGISQKDVLDLALEMIEECFEQDREALLEKQEVLKAAKDRPSGDTARKSHVVSRGTRDRFTELSEEYDIPRNGLVEVGLELTRALTKVQIQRHEEALEEIEAYYDRGRELEKKLKEDLGSEDPVRDGFSKVMLSLEMLKSEIEEEIEHGSPIDTSGM